MSKVQNHYLYPGYTIPRCIRTCTWISKKYYFPQYVLINEQYYIWIAQSFTKELVALVLDLSLFFIKNENRNWTIKDQLRCIEISWLSMTTFVNLVLIHMTSSYANIFHLSRKPVKNKTGVDFWRCGHIYSNSRISGDR